MIALTAAQMAQLTSDIVWLVEQTVTLADGSTERVLVLEVQCFAKCSVVFGENKIASEISEIVLNRILGSKIN